MSKTFFDGRLAHGICGRQTDRIIAALARVKSYLDYGRVHAHSSRRDRRAERSG